MVQTEGFFEGQFVVPAAEISNKLSTIKAYIFDWDGVFNSGHKTEHTGSSFCEIDSMGTNLLRYNHYLIHKSLPFVAIVSGENNANAAMLAKRENFNALYSGFRNKPDALNHFCEALSIEPSEVAFFFDDVLDLSLAKICGLRMMIGRSCNPLMVNYATENGLVDYISHCDGQNGGVRECAELLMGLSGGYSTTLKGRIEWSDSYQQFLKLRNTPATEMFIMKDAKVYQQPRL